MLSIFNTIQDFAYNTSGWCLVREHPALLAQMMSIPGKKVLPVSES